MPNHVHGIIHIKDTQTTKSELAVNDVETSPQACGYMIGAYKSIMFNTCLKIFKSHNQQMGKLWQRNFYEHIIRNKKSYDIISNYIINNPVTWNADKFYNPG